MYVPEVRFAVLILLLDNQHAPALLVNKCVMNNVFLRTQIWIVELVVLHVQEVQRVRLILQALVIPANVPPASLVMTIIVELVELPVQEDKHVNLMYANVLKDNNLIQ